MESAAHQFICITELYELLLMHLAQGKSYERNDISIARLARVSKMTSNLALDLLWKNLSRPSRIIHLLPDDVYELTPNRKYNLTRPLVEGDFAVFDKYAPRVRSVDFASSFTGISAGCELFATLKSFRDPIFPHLLNFEWHPTAKFNTMVKVSDEPVQATANFATGPGPADTITLFRQPLSSWLPDVSSLVLQTGTYLQKAAILDGLASISNLQHLDARLALNADILFHLAGLPNLKSLHMWEQENQTILTLRQTITQHGLQSFPVLESLEIYAPGYALSVFLPLVTSNALESVFLSTKDFEPIDNTMFSSLVAFPSRRSTLRHFTFHTPDPTYTHGGRHALFSMTMFAPLLRCANIETWDIKFDALQVDFDDADLERMAAAWPRLRTLRFYSRYTQQTAWADPQVHLYALWSLVQSCRRLRVIEMAVDARVEGPFVTPQGSLGGAYTVEKICFFLSPCGPPAHVAAFLNLAFPHLEEFNAGAPKPEQEASSARFWDEVREELPGVDRMFRAMRSAFANQPDQDEETVDAL